MEKINVITLKRNVRFSELTNKSKRKVYKEISKRYNGNNISTDVKFDFFRDIPKMAASFFEAYHHLFTSYKMEIYDH